MPTTDQSANRKDQKQVGAKERQRLSNQRKPLEKRLQKLESEIDGMQQKKASIELLLASSDMYEAAKKDELRQLLQEQQHCTATLEQLESEWLQIQDSLEQITLDE